MSYSSEPIQYFNPEGHEVLEQSETLQEIVEMFEETPSPERHIGGRFIGVGKYSYVRLIDDVVVKVSSPTTSKHSHESDEPIKPENLISQFNFLGALGGHLEKTNSNIIVPQQYFVLRSVHNAYLLGQQYMGGWETYADWSDKTYPHPEKDREFDAMNLRIKQRITDVVGHNKLHHGLNDLRLQRDGLHLSNILVPQAAEIEDSLPLCIIDQPGLSAKQKTHNTVDGAAQS